MEIEGLTLGDLKALPPADLDELLSFGRPIAFRMGSATILAEFNRIDDELRVNLAHIEGGGEGVLLALWKLIEAYAANRQFPVIRWNVHARTCANPNPRLQRFLRARGFQEAADETHGRVLSLMQRL